MEEIWKPIPEYEGLYEASTLGRIRSAEGKITSSARFPKRVWKQRIIKPKIEKRKGSNGFADERVSLWKNGEVKTLLVARLVAMAFMPCEFEKMTVNHINGNTQDNRIENLEWLTLKENIQHGYKSGLYDGVKKPVVLIDECGNERHFETMSLADKFLNKRVGYISNVIGKGKHAAHDEHGNTYIAKLETG
jgi:hypothetical protein